MPPRLDPQLLQQVFNKEAAALREFVKLALPHIQAEVASILYFHMRGGAARHDVSAEIADFVHDVFLQLWSSEFRPLRDWQPGGRSLEGYLRQYTKFRVLEVLRAKRRNPFMGDLKDTEALDQLGQSSPVEPQVADKELVAKLSEQIAKLPAEDQEFLRLDRIEELPIAELQARFAMPTSNSVHQRRRRLLGKLKHWRDQLLSVDKKEK